MRLEQCAEFLSQSTKAIFPHLGNECKKHQPLAEERQLPWSRRSQHPVHAQLLSRLAEYGEQRVGQHGQQEQRVSSVMACDDGLRESQSKARVLHIPARLLHREAPSIGHLDLDAFEILPTADQTPRLLYG